MPDAISLATAEQIIVLSQAGRSQHEIAAALSIDRKTVRRYWRTSDLPADTTCMRCRQEPACRARVYARAPALCEREEG